MRRLVPVRERVTDASNIDDDSAIRIKERVDRSVSKLEGLELDLDCQTRVIQDLLGNVGQMLVTATSNPSDIAGDKQYLITYFETWQRIITEQMDDLRSCIESIETTVTILDEYSKQISP